MATATYRLERKDKHEAVFAEVTVGYGPGASPAVARLPERIAGPAQEGLAEAAVMLGLDPAALAIHGVRHRYEESTPGVVQSAAFMAVAELAGRAEHFKPEPSIPDWHVIDRRPWPGPDAPGIWVRRPRRLGQPGPPWCAMLYLHGFHDERGRSFRSPSGALWHVTGWIRASGALWRHRFPGSLLGSLACDDPDAVLAENDILLLVDPQP
ncbi:hypothetical protein SAMN02745121_08337 [Nannocystis exedens]|uniref:Uncharacterized protein n=1 Tax=Nannocystis exedens TaxID=54 RepID=A0A1I2I2Z9_9BACT|nr:hypothetical protein [Nannocystis exedens]PCC73538.1 hypothetical protein NAEX_06626 [Nannocystis exedens]SFF35457.1 hypothetical protein SAMN02745121_08337 [Nannocystis exedens]